MLERADAKDRRTIAEDRKRDARQKIELGGLIVKAGLREADRAVLLGALIELSKHSSNKEEWSRLRAIGRAAFIRDPEKTRLRPHPGFADNRNDATADRS